MRHCGDIGGPSGCALAAGRCTWCGACFALSRRTSRQWKVEDFASSSGGHKVRIQVLINFFLREFLLISAYLWFFFAIHWLYCPLRGRPPNLYIFFSSNFTEAEALNGIINVTVTFARSICRRFEAHSNITASIWTQNHKPELHTARCAQ